MDETIPVKSTKLSLDIVEEVAIRDGAGGKELAREFDIPQSTIHDHLTTLARAGYLLNHSGTYRISTKFLGIAERARNNRLIYQVGKPAARKLAHQSGERAGLMIEEAGDGIFLYTTRSNDAESLSLDEYAGIRIPLYVSAPSKAILANMPEARLDEIIVDAHITGKLPGDATPEELRAELETIRDDGYAVSRGERIEGMLAIAAPIIDENDRPRGSLSVYGPIKHIESKEMIDEYSVLVKKAANVTEVNLEHS